MRALGPPCACLWHPHTGRDRTEQAQESMSLRETSSGIDGTDCGNNPVIRFFTAERHARGRE